MIDPRNKTIPETSPNVSADAAAVDVHDSTMESSPMQPDDLHDLFATPADFDSGDEEDPLAQLRNDPNYSALIRDLEYIATQARLLFEPSEEAPSDEVWNKIQQGLKDKHDA